MVYLRLKELLSDKEISGRELAEKVGVSANAISQIATGKTQPRFELMEKIANAINVDIRDLFESTKTEDFEEIYIKKGDQLVSIGKIKLMKD